MLSEVAILLRHRRKQLGEDAQIPKCAHTASLLFPTKKEGGKGPRIVHPATHTHFSSHAPPFCSVFKMTHDYVERFSQFKTENAVKQLRKTLMRIGLSEVEAVALANLCPISAQEARALVPSLGHMDDEQLEAIIADLKNFKLMT